MKVGKVSVGFFFFFLYISVSSHGPHSDTSRVGFRDEVEAFFS